MSESHEAWISNLADSLGIPSLDTTLLDDSRKFVDKNSGNKPFLFESILEFSFVAGDRRGGFFRYDIDVSQWELEKVKNLLETGLKSIAIPIICRRQGSTRFILDWVSSGSKSNPLDFIGAEHSNRGSISSLKTYWNSQIPLNNILCLMPSEERDASERIFRTIHELCPAFDRTRFVGVDFLVSGGMRVKLYFPHRGSPELLPLTTVSSLMVSLGLDAGLDELAKLSYFCLNKQLEVVPTAFIVGVVLSKTPSVKLEIASKAYFKNTEEVIRSASSMAIAMGIDPDPFYTGIYTLQRCSPLRRTPEIKVICIEFLPKDNNRMIMYCKL